MSARPTGQLVALDSRFVDAIDNSIDKGSRAVRRRRSEQALTFLAAALTTPSTFCGPAAVEPETGIA
jgi:hypothetical protein